VVRQRMGLLVPRQRSDQVHCIERTVIGLS
jgi:hypothetical protein